MSDDKNDAPAAADPRYTGEQLESAIRTIAWELAGAIFGTPGAAQNAVAETLLNPLRKMLYGGHAMAIADVIALRRQNEQLHENAMREIARRNDEIERLKQQLRGSVPMLTGFDEAEGNSDRTVHWPEAPIAHTIQLYEGDSALVIRATRDATGYGPLADALMTGLDRPALGAAMDAHCHGYDDEDGGQ